MNMNMKMENKQLKGIIDTHLPNGACQDNTMLVKNDTLIFLSGFTAIGGKMVNVKQGWYDFNLNFVEEFTEEDEEYIANDLIPF